LAEGLNSTIVWEMGAETFQLTFVSKRAETFFGYPLEQWYTDPAFWRDKLHPDDRQKVLSLFESALEQGTDQRCDHRMIAADGRTVWFHTGVRPVREEGGAAMLRGLSADMTAQREAAEAIRKSQERYQRLVDSIDGIVWEADAETFRFRFVSKQAERRLGYPLSLWLNDPDFWKDHIYPDDLEQVLSLWNKGVAEGSGFDMTYRMVTADGPTKIEAGRMDLHAQAHALSLSEMVQQVLRDLRLIWEEKGLDVTWNDDPTAPLIRSDSGKLRQIFTNLIANAVKFTDRGSIAVALIHDAKKKTVSVEIKDTGQAFRKATSRISSSRFTRGKSRRARGPASASPS
jgi:PAS domain S-box-containing protein